jgi:hypothetical protein
MVKATYGGGNAVRDYGVEHSNTGEAGGGAQLRHGQGHVCPVPALSCTYISYMYPTVLNPACSMPCVVLYRYVAVLELEQGPVRSKQKSVEDATKGERPDSTGLSNTIEGCQVGEWSMSWRRVWQ